MAGYAGKSRFGRVFEELKRKKIPVTFETLSLLCRSQIDKCPSKIQFRGIRAIPMATPSILIWLTFIMIQKTLAPSASRMGLHSDKNSPRIKLTWQHHHCHQRKKCAPSLGVNCNLSSQCRSVVICRAVQAPLSSCGRMGSFSRKSILV